ncbi:MAG: asparaginase [Hyphomicrobiaceae bacterium]|nr:asparaginase [Hyphomicrobiaceae bacterium]
MSNPVLVQLTRGPQIESTHRGAVCIVRADGSPFLELGNVDAPIYPRSAIKVLQALALVESGAADAAGFTDKELALACSSHNGEPMHVEGARGMLAKCGLALDALACGIHWPLDPDAAHALAASGQCPDPLHNNCSGKHAGMLALATHLKVDVGGYDRPDHPIQRRIRETIEEVAGETLSPDVCAVDGCSVPTWAMPLKSIAGAFAALTSPDDLSKTRASAVRRLFHACTSEPLMVEGTARFGTGVMERFGPAAFVKGGAEGVYCAAFPEHGLGLALKVDDGARRGAEAAAAFIIAGLVAGQITNAGEIFKTTLKNWRGLMVGEVQPSAELAGAIAKLAS